MINISNEHTCKYIELNTYNINKTSTWVNSNQMFAFKDTAFFENSPTVNLSLVDDLYLMPKYIVKTSSTSNIWHKVFDNDLSLLSDI